MTPQLTLVSNSAQSTSGHLTEEQFGELLAPSAGSELKSAQAHLLVCEQCSAELASLRESLSLFRQATNAYADNELRRMPPVSLPARGILSPTLVPTYWAAAAAIFLVLLPLQAGRHHTFRAAPDVSASSPQSVSLSDEALLEDVDTYTSAAVPEPMQALADPGLSSTGTTSTAQNPDQRKD